MKGAFMFENFVSFADIISYPGMIATVILLVQFTKRLFDNVLPAARTRWVAYGWSAALCILAAIYTGDWSSPVPLIAAWLVNSVVVWFAAMKAFETITGKDAAK
jgi:hypothetical protein